MRRMVFGISLVLFMSLIFGTQAGAQDTKKQSRIEGRVQMINKDKSEIVVQRGTSPRSVFYNSETKWTKLNKPGSMDFKEGYRVICVGARLLIRNGGKTGDLGLVKQS